LGGGADGATTRTHSGKGNHQRGVGGGKRRRSGKKHIPLLHQKGGGKKLEGIKMVLEDELGFGGKGKKNDHWFDQKLVTPQKKENQLCEKNRQGKNKGGGGNNPTEHTPLAYLSGWEEAWGAHKDRVEEGTK